MTAVKLKKFVLCDDVRVELGGKYFLIGVYPGDVIVADVPGTIYFSAYVEFEADEEGEFVGEYRFLLEKSGAVVQQAPATLRVALRETPTAMYFRHVSIKAGSAGKYLAQWRSTNGSWQSIGEIIVASPSTGAIPTELL